MGCEYPFEKRGKYFAYVFIKKDIHPAKVLQNRGIVPRSSNVAFIQLPRSGIRKVTISRIASTLDARWRKDIALRYRFFSGSRGIERRSRGDREIHVALPQRRPRFFISLIFRSASPRYSLDSIVVTLFMALGSLL